MSLSVNQYQKIYNKHLLKILKEGRIPGFEEVLASADEELPEFSNALAPSFKFVPQTANATFDIALYNKSIDRIMSDLELLFDEITEIEIKNVKRVLHSSFFHGVHSYELSKISRQLDALLFAVSGAEEYFFVKNESFNDISTTDISMSTPSVVDLSEGSISLPISARGTKKINLSHLYPKATVDIKPTRPDARVIGNIPETKFGDIFLDSERSWGIVVQSSSNAPLAVEFSFSLKLEEFINRITITSFSPSKQVAFIETSVDSYNIKSILEYSNGVLLDDHSTNVSLDFADTLVEYIYITLSKDSPDSYIDIDGERIYEYIFGLRNISIFSTGRSLTASFVSKPFDFTSLVPTIERVAISANELIPNSTSIDWSIGVIDNDGALVGSMIPVTPETRSDNSSYPKVLKLSESTENNKYISSVPGSYSSLFEFHSNTFYSIGTIESEPIFGPTKLYRGSRAWYRDTKGAYETVSVKDNFIPFSKGNIQSLYIAKNEVATIKTIANDPDTRVILLSKAPLYSNNGIYSLIPLAGTDTSKDTSPSYAIYNVELSSGPIEVSKDNISFTGGSYDIGQPNIVYNEPSSILIQKIVANKVAEEYVDGRDYIVELDSNGYPTGIIIATTNSPLTSGNYRIVYTKDPNITRFVSDISDKQVFFSITAINPNVATDESVIIKYRHTVDSVIKSSIKAKDRFGEATGVVYRQGADYAFDTLSSDIQRLTTGSITSDKDIYVDFKYKEPTVGIHQFFIWAYVSKSSGIDVLLKARGSGTLNNQNELNPDTEKGESLSANIQGVGIVELTNAMAWPNMKGWVQFIVKSRPPEDLLDSSSIPLINQVIKLRDRYSNYIFVKGGIYFNDLTGIREPMSQVSLPFLKTNVLKNDKRFFAVKPRFPTSEHDIVLNFEPNTDPDLYRYSISPTTNNIIEISEEWKLLWHNRESINPYTKLIVKAVLSRAPNLDGNITPKVYNFLVKVSY